MLRPIAAAAFALAAIAAPSAHAECAWEWLCNGEGACKHVPICNSVFDTPPAEDTTSPPIVPPHGTRPDRIASMRGELTCQHIMRQTSSGRWFWTEACFCTDPSKGEDPSLPLANQVRCRKSTKE